ncbi:hypothetical protein PBI_ELVA_1 [Microbacterium phage Elva]|uniref:hypothetical protein n=1 Tax=Microbacterium phage Elva TaxID=2126929 RepID=UPI000D2148B0|nr:hypothetical protein QDW20_gp01 [Microbacterium phage Elva]AVR56744.1 hypothetical protein PBI_ELVA_1 [Microbacterium phage Elva]
MVPGKHQTIRAKFRRTLRVNREPLIHVVEQQLCGAGRNPVASRIDTGRPHYRLRLGLGAGAP